MSRKDRLASMKRRYEKLCDEERSLAESLELATRSRLEYYRRMVAYIRQGDEAGDGEPPENPNPHVKFVLKALDRR